MTRPGTVLLLDALEFGGLIASGVQLPDGRTAPEAFYEVVTHLAGQIGDRLGDLMEAQALAGALVDRESTPARSIAKMVLDMVRARVDQLGELDAELDRNIEGWQQ